jgi:hypothetical protein
MAVKEITCEGVDLSGLGTDPEQVPVDAVMNMRCAEFP